ncbi:MAG: SDR family NAD(P)-dependent oxidoreductase [bacterium]|nr:SDR family NAD(P)-dependent oxidoreductase [bacterium]
MGSWIRHHLSRRPGWMNALMLFCAFMALIYVPWDLFVKPIAVDEEVWFGVRFHGVWAKALEIPHWFVYAAGMVGFWRLHSWMWPWAAVYSGQVALSMLIWPMLYQEAAGSWVIGLVAGAAFMLPTLGLWNARDLFRDKKRKPLCERYGDWALVTGASAGIGSEFARALAREGVSCVLAARREDRLKELGEEIARDHGVDFRTVPVDLSTATGVELLLSQVADLEIGMLVNNAGFGYTGRFDKQDRDRLSQMVQLNCAAPVALAAELLPGMRERGRGAVIFTGSVAGSQPLPLHALYSATKSFDNLLAEGLWGELQGTGVDVLALLPGATESEFVEAAGGLPHAGEPPERVVEVALDALGFQPSVISGWFNWLRANLAFRIMPRSWLTLVARDFTEKTTPEEMH